MKQQKRETNAISFQGYLICKKINVNSNIFQNLCNSTFAKFTQSVTEMIITWKMKLRQKQFSLSFSEGFQMTYFDEILNSWVKNFPVNTGRNVSCTFNLRPVSTGLLSNY